MPYRSVFLGRPSPADIQEGYYRRYLMKFSVLERVLLGQLLSSPRVGGYEDLKLLRVTREALSFSEAEHKRLCFRSVGADQQWKGSIVVEKATGKEIDFTPEDLAKDPEMPQKKVDSDPEVYEFRPSVEDKKIAIGEYVSGLIATELKALEEAEKLSEQLVPLFERFVVNKKAPAKKPAKSKRKKRPGKAKGKGK